MTMIPMLLLLAQMSCPDHAAHAMGFPQETTRHHFRVLPDGGAIEVRGSAPDDVAAIRKHLQAIAKAFAEGDFSKPLAVHDKLPDGAADMKELRGAIRYRYEELPEGGRVRITTADAKALDAVHRFLRFQIREHSGAAGFSPPSPKPAA
jgi:hypothetical protein